MRIAVIPCRWPLSPNEWPLRMAAAIEAAGDTATLEKGYRPGFDAYVFWGLRRTWGLAALKARAPSVVVERAYLGDRFKWHAVGLNGLNGRADFRNADVPPDRWERLWRPSLQPWQLRPDGYALVVGQVWGDAALRGTDPYAWAAGAIAEARKHYRRVLFRPHPLCRRKRPVPGAEVNAGPLEEALAGAAVVITHSSNTAVDAVMAGVPAVSSDDGSMARAVTSHAVGAPLYTGDRDDWGRRIAYAQWLPEEFPAAWRHIRGGLCSSSS